MVNVHRFNSYLIVFHDGENIYVNPNPACAEFWISITGKVLFVEERTYCMERGNSILLYAKM